MSISINLIPESVRWAQHRRRLLSRWAVALSLVIGSLLVPFAIDRHEQGRAERLRTQHERMQGELADLRVQVQEATGQAERMAHQLRRAQAVLAKRRWTGVLWLIAQTMPDQCWLTSVATDPVKPSPGSLANSTKRLVKTSGSVEENVTLVDTPRRLRISGFSVDAFRPHRLVRRLKRSGSFERVALEGVERELVRGEEFFRFDLTCEW